MAIAFGSFTASALVTASSLTFAHDVGSGTDRRLFVGILGDVGGGADDISGVTFNGDAMTLAAKNITSTLNRLIYLYFIDNPDSGSHDVVVSAGSSHFLTGAAFHYTDAAQTGTVDATGSAQNASASVLATTLTTVADNCWTVLIAMISFDAGTGPSAGTGSTERGEADATFKTMGVYDSNGPITPAALYSMTFNRVGGTGNMGSVMASFAPAGAAPATPSRPIFQSRTRFVPRHRR